MNINLSDLRLGNGFLDISKVQHQNKKIYKLYFIEILIFCAPKDAIKIMKSHSKGQDKIFTNLISDKRLVPGIYT